MDIILDNIGKRYIQEWVFRGITDEIKQGDCVAITGRNGSGKSTLLQIISGYRLPSTGKIKYMLSDKEVEGNEIFSYISFASPYLELIEEFTMKEQLSFHFTWRDTRFSTEEIGELFNISGALNKPIKYFSSGMKQRLKLAMAFCTKSDLLLLDEPTSNLDSEGIKVYDECIESLADGRTIIIASNDPLEYKYCNRSLQIDHYK